MAGVVEMKRFRRRRINPLGTRGGILVKHYFPFDAEYIVKLRLWRNTLDLMRGMEDPHQIEMSLDGARLRLVSAGGKEDFVRMAQNPGDFGSDLERSHNESIRLRQTIVGPHRDDLELIVDHLPAAQFASEGQQRTIALAMKIAQAETLKKSGEGKAPLLLIDDIFGELDHERRNALLDNLPADSQELTTATAMPWRDEITADTIYEMRDRRLRRM